MAQGMHPLFPFSLYTIFPPTCSSQTACCPEAPLDHLVSWVNFVLKPHWKLILIIFEGTFEWLFKPVRVEGENI